MQKNKTYILILLSILSYFSINAQEKETKIALRDILQNLSAQHAISFNYLEDEIVLFRLVQPKATWSLEEKINYIQKETGLHFTVTNQKYYTIYNDQRLDKPLCGFVLDLETKSAIPNANIHIKNTTVTVISDSIGYFELPKISSNNIQISHVTYETIVLSPENLLQSNCPKLYLKPNITAIEEVVSQNYLTSGIAIKKDGSIRIQPKKIGHLPGLTEPDVFKTVQQIPGIQSIDESISDSNIRGGTNDQNLVLWNGIRLFQTGHFFGLISALNPNLAHTVSVFKNGSPAIYGESTSGVFAISTHNKTIEEGNSAIGINWINADFYTKQKLSQKASLEVSGRRAFTDALQTPTYQKYSDKIFQNTTVTNTSDNKNIRYTNQENFYFYDATIQYHQKINAKSTLFLDALIISNQLDLKQSKIENINTITKNSALEQNTFGASFLFLKDWNPKNHTEIQAYTSQYTVNSTNEAIESNQLFSQSNMVKDNSFSLFHNYALHPKLDLKTGYQFQDVGIRNADQINNPFFYRNTKEVLQSHIGIIEATYSSTSKKIYSKLGWRNNYYPKFGLYIPEPRIQISYQYNPNLSLQLLGEAKNQTTSQIIDLQQDFLGISKKRWVLANTNDVPVQKSKQLSLGVNYKRNNLLISLDNYYKKVEGITTKSQGFQNQLEFINTTGNYTAIGLEALVQKQISNFTVWVSYSVSKNEYQFSEFTPSVFPNNYAIRQAVAYALIYDNQKLKLALGTRWHTGKPTTSPNAQQPTITQNGSTTIQYNSPNSERLAAFYQTNFSGSYTLSFVKKTKLQLGFSIENIWNHTNIIHQYYRYNTNTKSIEKVNTFSLERTPNAFMRFYF